jgi:ketosteroid isomerase-like protein
VRRARGTSRGPAGAERVAADYFAAYDAHDIEAMLDLCSDDATLRHVPMGWYETGSIYKVGPKAWGDLFKALPDLRVVVHRLISDGDRASAEVVIAEPARGFELPQAYFLTLDDTHRIVDVTVYWDNIGLGFQLTKAGAEGLAHAVKSFGRH